VRSRARTCQPRKQARSSGNRLLIRHSLLQFKVLRLNQFIRGKAPVGFRINANTTFTFVNAGLWAVFCSPSDQAVSLVTQHQFLISERSPHTGVWGGCLAVLFIIGLADVRRKVKVETLYVPSTPRRAEELAD